METEANIQLIQRFWQASERGDIDEMSAFWPRMPSITEGRPRRRNADHRRDRRA